jgi:hypothetical protein
MKGVEIDMYWNPLKGDHDMGEHDFLALVIELAKITAVRWICQTEY